MRVWAENVTLRETEAKRDVATNFCKIDGYTYETRAPEEDDLFDVLLLTKEKAKRFPDGMWYLSDSMEIPDDMDTKTLGNMLKMSPQEMAECLPCLITHINSDFKWAVEKWFTSEFQRLAIPSEVGVPGYIPFCLTSDEIVASANVTNIKKKESLQSDFFQNRNKNYLGWNWAGRTNTKLPKKTKRSLNAVARARNTARGQVLVTGAELVLPAPINRDFKTIQNAWTSIMQPARMAVYPPETEYDAAMTARLWAIELEAILFGEGVQALSERKKDENLVTMKESMKKSKEYQKVVKDMNVKTAKL